MYELIQVSENDYYIDCPAKIGVVKINDSQVILIDSGSDTSAGKTILKILEENQWNLQAVYLTHSHADHIGGNKVIQDRTGCSIYANGIECPFCNYPVLEPTVLYGATPVPELRCKFLEAQTSVVLPLTESSLPEGFKIVPLYGHTDGMVGYLTPDGTLYCGDALASEENLQKHPVTFLSNVNQYILSLEKLKSFEASCFVPSHAPVSKSIKELAQHNIETVLRISDEIQNLLSPSKTFETLLSEMMDKYSIQGSMIQYCLIGSTLKAYLNYLSEQEKITYTFDGSVLLWKSNQP